MKFYTLILTVILSLSVPVFAQIKEETTPHTFANGVSLHLSSPWTIETDDDEAEYLTTPDTALDVFLYTLPDLAYNEREPGDVAGALAYLHESNLQKGQSPFDPAELQTTEYNGYEISYYEVLISDNGDEYYRTRGAMVITELGEILLFSATPQVGSNVTELDAILEVVTTIEPNVFYFEDGSFIQTPLGWDTYQDDNGYTVFTDDNTSIRLEFRSPDALDELGADAKNLQPVIEALLGEAANDTSLVFDASAFTSEKLGAFPVQRYSFMDTLDGVSYERIWLLDVLPDGWVMILDLTPVIEETLAPEAFDAAKLIISSFTLPEG